MIWVGTDLKFAINIICEGFVMDEDDFKIVLVNGKRKLEFNKDDLVENDGTWYLCFNSEDIGAGDIDMITYAYVPDGDFKDGYRTEIYKSVLCHLSNV
jgi:hypothetical protein